MNDNQAIALQYNGEDTPTVLATGMGELADEILAIARESEVPIFENRELTALMASLELGDEIPEELFHVIAEILAFSYWIRGMVPNGWQE